MKKIGILELGTPLASGSTEYVANLFERKQYVGVTPQAISVWCRQMGHEVHYAVYYGNGDPKAKLPNDLDIVFICVFTFVAPLAYALSKLFRREGARTVVGGPHAKAFPHDALRYFDLVVLECDQALIADIIADRIPPGSIVSSPQSYADTPTIEERLPEIKASTFWRGRPFPYGTIPMLASMGCPYTCNFCVDWNNYYRPLPADRLTADLRFAAERLPGVPLAFLDPNFGIRFDETLAIFEAVPEAQRSPYAMESSLSNLRSPERLARLRASQCIGVAPGIESWTQYSNKAGVGKAILEAKLAQVVAHLQLVAEYIPYIQANFIMGVDSDSGEEPFELTREFLFRLPSVFPCFFVPVAYGGTPLFNDFLREERILKAMPFNFYFTPYLTLILKNYDAQVYFQKMADLHSLLAAPRVIGQRLAARRPWYATAINLGRTFAYQGLATIWRDLARRLRTDPQLRAFHAGETRTLPDYYAGEYRRQLGKFAELMPIHEAQPVLDQLDAPPLKPARAHIPLASLAGPAGLEAAAGAAA